MSVDLVHWEHLPIAIAPSEGGIDADGTFTGVLPTDSPAAIVYTEVTKVDHERETIRAAHGRRPGPALTPASISTRTRTLSPECLQSRPGSPERAEHADGLQPLLHEHGPAADGQLSGPQAERVTALRIQVHLCRDAGLLQLDVVG
jgi:hypothetical protein